MTLGVQVLAGWMGFVVVFALALLAWAIYSGQLDDIEALKYIPFDEKEPVAWPDRRDVAKEVRP